MLVNDDIVFGEFHKARLAEHVPAQYFIKQHGLEIKRHTFLEKYSKWRRKQNLSFTNLDVSQYLQWMENHYKLPIEKNVQYHSSNSIAFQPLTIAVTIFITTYPDLMGAVLSDCGLTTVSYNNCRKQLISQGMKFVSTI